MPPLKRDNHFLMLTGVQGQDLGALASSEDEDKPRIYRIIPKDPTKGKEQSAHKLDTKSKYAMIIIQQITSKIIHDIHILYSDCVKG